MTSSGSVPGSTRIAKRTRTASPAAIVPTRSPSPSSASPSSATSSRANESGDGFAFARDRDAQQHVVGARVAVVVRRSRRR